MLARNRINSIQPTIANYIPNLKTLVLTSNNFAELADLDPLKLLPKLTHLSLLDNAVTRKEVRCSFFFFFFCAILQPPALPTNQSGPGRLKLKKIGTRSFDVDR